MSRGDNRRERYAAALHEVESQCRHDASSFACHELADAAMAVADAEIATLLAQLATAQLRGEVAYDRAVAAEQENARLRTGLSSAIDNAREFVGPVEMPYESQGPAMFARGWHAALDYIERGKPNGRGG